LILIFFRYAHGNKFYIKILKKNYVKNHPYGNIHPWKSLLEFSSDLVNNLIYNEDGLIILNKPYGIRSRKSNSFQSLKNNVSNGVNYTLEDALPYIAKELNYPNLNIIKSPEMYMSGITLLAANSNIQNAIELAYIHGQYFINTYWIVTVGIPKQSNNYSRLGIKLVSHPQFKNKKQILITSWSKNEEKKIKILKTEYKILSNSILNLCSLIQLVSSTHHKHAIRLFASTFLYCPILGDNIYASQIQKIGNTYVRVHPFFTCSAPKLDDKLFKLLGVKPNNENIIPTHIHLRSIVLRNFLGKTLKIEAPLPPYFDWTCNQLEFKHIIETENCKSHLVL
ncbi:mitochondrial RNA pseudouridine synthase rpusd4, partial [Apis mellifera]|uniref:Mitochondrial RNA pseudouridine synthase rpusd4 n=1 Tax=Apis mellifera TaxID=7460 RepID=A0A7M7MT88_APIME